MAPESPKVQQIIRFGEDLEFEPDLYELRRAGHALKLERIPMDILLLLINDQGKIVDRQKIADRIWGKELHLDADNSINCAVRKIRQVLKDDPERPRFIQTVPGRGYRFIAPVTADEPVEDSAATKPSALLHNGTSPAPPSNPLVEAPSISPPHQEASHSSHSDTTPTTHRSARRFVVLGVLLLIAVAGIFIWWRTRARDAASQRKLQLAVLPFQNLTGDAGQEYFSDGFTEEMITQMGNLDPQHLAVIARTSVMYYKGKQESTQRIAHDLGVQYVLEGSVRRDANNIRITAQLIQASDQTHLWAREYDRAPQDLLTIQSEIAREIADEIELSLDNQKQRKPAVQASLSPQEYEAHDLYLKGRYLWSTRKDLRGAAYWFKQAVAKDPTYSRAYAGLADSYSLMSSYGDAEPNEYMPQARAAALKALQLDDSLAEAHTSLALVAQNYDWDWQTAEKEYRRAIQLNPNYATAHHWFAECLALQGRFNEALEESERARQLDPLSLIIAADNGVIYYFSRQYDRAISRFKEVLDEDPSNGRAHVIIAAYIAKGDYKDAQTVIDRWTGGKADNAWGQASEAFVYGRSGNVIKAKQSSQKLEAILRKSSGYDPAPLLISAAIGVGDNEKELALLQDAYRRRTNTITTLKVEPMYDPLRNDPRFQELLRHAGFVH